jgi:phage shock protein E
MTRILIAAVLAFAGCSKSEAPAPPPETPAKPAKDPAAARKLIAEGAVVLDVRTADEYADGHVPSATNLPVQEMPRRIAEVDKLVGGDKAKPVVVYCGAGKRAAKVKQQLEAAGYTSVVNGGGYDDLR